VFFSLTGDNGVAKEGCPLFLKKFEIFSKSLPYVFSEMKIFEKMSIFQLVFLKMTFFHKIRQKRLFGTG